MDNSNNYAMTKIEVLIIEDNAEILENIAELLELEGFNIKTASCGEDGLQMAFSQIPDMIISDIMMPGVDGYQLLKEINKNPDTNRIPFIFVTAKAEKSERKEGLKLGADAYIIKPFKTEDLIRMIYNCLEKKSYLSNSS